MSQAAVHRPPARFDASVVPGAKPAPFAGFGRAVSLDLREKAPPGERWIYEIKFDGYRAQAHLRNGQPTIYTRAGYDYRCASRPSPMRSRRCRQPT